MALCTRGVQTAQGRSLSQEGALVNDEVTDPAPQSMVLFFVLSARGVSVLSCCQVGTPFVNPDMGEKKTEFSPRSVPAAHIPLQEEAPQCPPAGGPSGSPVSCKVALGGLPSFGTEC